MDRSYKEDIPKYRAALEELKQKFSALDSNTDWTALRIRPLLKHVKTLDQILKSPDFARETARLRKGVAMFHADLVYFRTNIKELRTILASETKTAGRKAN